MLSRPLNRLVSASQVRDEVGDAAIRAADSRGHVRLIH